MKKLSIFAYAFYLTVTVSCKKNEDAGTNDFENLKTQILVDFTNIVAVPGYQQLDAAATDLQTSIENLNNDATESNLATARSAWKNMRGIWEQCEGYLFGPVEDNDYDPNMDTWPTDYVQLDSLLASNSPLSVANIQNLTLSLRGYHPIEYIIFGDHGSRTAASLTERQKLYVQSLATDLKNTCHSLYVSWVDEPVNFAKQVMTAGAGSTVYSKKQEAYLAIIESMTGICEEVGEGKMKEPFDTRDPKTVESPYSGNSVSDFKDNIIGVQNVYLGRLGSADGKGLNDLVAAGNISLDNKIQGQLTSAINSFNNISVNYEEAIITQRVQCQQTMDALATLKETLENELKPYIVQNIKD
ncbi:MAG: imelysin family protein [Ginsengibacter sp.]